MSTIRSEPVSDLPPSCNYVSNAPVVLSVHTGTEISVIPDQLVGNLYPCVLPVGQRSPDLDYVKPIGEMWLTDPVLPFDTALPHT